MARLFSKEKDAKVKAVKKAFEVLKSESIEKNKNIAIPSKIWSLANSYESIKEFKKEISLQSIKQPSGKEFKNLKTEIDAFRKDFKTINNCTSLEIKELTNKIQLLTFQLVECIDKELNLQQQVLSLKESLEQSNKERNIYYEKIVELNEN